MLTSYLQSLQSPPSIDLLLRISVYILHRHVDIEGNKMLHELKVGTWDGKMSFNFPSTNASKTQEFNHKINVI